MLLKFVKVSLRSQFSIGILVVLPLCEHVVDQPDGQQVEVGDADTELHTASLPAHFCEVFSCLYLRLHVQAPQFDQLGQNLVDGEGCKNRHPSPICTQF